MANNDEFNLSELLGSGEEEELSAPLVREVLAPTAPSQLSEVNVRPREVLCSHCDCFMVGMRGSERICRHHKDHPNDKDCPDCARRKLVSTQAYIASGHTREQLAHPMAPSVLSDLPDAPSSIVSNIPPDPDIEVKELKAPEEELDREYWEVFNATIQEVKDLEPEKLQEIRHKHLRMIRRVKIMNQAIRQTEEGKLQLIDAKRRAKIREKDSEFMARRVREKEQEAAAGGSSKRSSATKGMSAVEKQIRQFCKMNVPAAAIPGLLTAAGTAIPENIQELIEKHRK